MRILRRAICQQIGQRRRMDQFLETYNLPRHKDGLWAHGKMFNIPNY